MGRFEGRDDPLQAAQQLQGLEGLAVGHGAVFGPADRLEVAVFRAHTGIVQTGADRMGLLDLTLTVLQQQTHGPMQHAHAALGDGGGMATGGHTIASGFHTDQPHGGIGHKGMKQAHGIGAAAHAGHQHIGIAAEGPMALALGLLTDHGVEIAHQHRVRMRTRHRPQDVMG